MFKEHYSVLGDTIMRYLYNRKHSNSSKASSFVQDSKYRTYAIFN